jgi:hypothetical protein
MSAGRDCCDDEVGRTGAPLSVFGASGGGMLLGPVQAWARGVIGE